MISVMIMTVIMMIIMIIGIAKSYAVWCVSIYQNNCGGFLVMAPWPNLISRYLVTLVALPAVLSVY